MDDSFRKCPSCGSLSTERRTRCDCGYRVDQGRSTSRGVTSKPRRSEPDPLPVRAAKYAIYFPIGAFAAAFFGIGLVDRHADTAFEERWMAFAFVALVGVLLAAGFVSVVIALLGIGEHGSRRIVPKALCGLLLCVGILLWFAPAFLGAGLLLLGG